MGIFILKNTSVFGTKRNKGDFIKSPTRNQKETMWQKRDIAMPLSLEQYKTLKSYIEDLMPKPEQKSKIKETNDANTEK